jgi:hypothetical protein
VVGIGSGVGAKATETIIDKIKESGNGGSSTDSKGGQKGNSTTGTK